MEGLRMNKAGRLHWTTRGVRVSKRRITDQERPPGPRNQGTREGKQKPRQGGRRLGRGQSIPALRTRQTHQAFGCTAAPHWQQLL